MEFEVLFDSMMTIPGVLSTGVPAPGVDLNETHPSFDEPSGDEALATKGARSERQWVPIGFGFVDAVHGDRLCGFLT